MNKKQYNFLPSINGGGTIEERNCIKADVIGNSPCPCCGFITIPNNGDALAYICPVCFWEIDLFVKSDDEASDLNNGLTLKEAKTNYKQFGAVVSNLRKYCRQPLKNECSKMNRIKIRQCKFFNT